MTHVRLTVLVLIPLLAFAGCDRQESKSVPVPATPPGPPGRPKKRQTLADARRGFQTTLLRHERGDGPPPEPPADLFRLVRYESPAGQLAAYVSTPPADGKRHPAIVWKFGGFSNGIGETAWEPAPPDNDQSAAAFREAGIVTMYPSVRGGNDNPGYREGFFGEVDDLLAAADYLARQDSVDPARIYLGGHSTGGTLALLASAASADRFRAVFAFGPAADVAGYGADVLPFPANDPQELALRSPARWVNAINSPTFVFEGTRAPSNVAALNELAAESRNPAVHLFPVRGASHFSILGPVTRLVAGKIVRDDGGAVAIDFTTAELEAAVKPPGGPPTRRPATRPAARQTRGDGG